MRLARREFRLSPLQSRNVNIVLKHETNRTAIAFGRGERKPQTLDTIVASNLHADILSDLAAALAGSLGIAPTANINPERKFPSMFEPIHGSAFDIMGKGVANPVGTFWSAVMMLDHLGEAAAAQRLMKAIERVTADPDLHTPDLGGAANTRKVTDAVIRAIQAENV